MIKYLIFVVFMAIDVFFIANIVCVIFYTYPRMKKELKSKNLMYNKIPHLFVISGLLLPLVIFVVGYLLTKFYFDSYENVWLYAFITSIIIALFFFSFSKKSDLDSDFVKTYGSFLRNNDNKFDL
jgi:hypothetical protein